MIRVRVKIGDGEIVDTQAYGLVFVSSDTFFEAPARDFETTTYPEQDGENILPKSTVEPFDYKVKYFIETNSLQNANDIVAEFNSLLFTQSSARGLRTYKQVTFFNDYKGVKIVGYPKLIAEAESFWRDSEGKQHDAVVVEWTIRVSDPSLCDFNYVMPS